MGRGENPPDGAILHLWLKETPKAKPKLEILDAEGKVVRSLAKRTEPEPPPAEPEGAAGKEPAGEEQEAKEKEKEEEKEEEADRPGGAGQAETARPSRDSIAWSGTWSSIPPGRSRTPRSMPAAPRSVRWPCPGSTP